MRKVILGLLIVFVVFIMSCSLIEFPEDVTGEAKYGAKKASSKKQVLKK
tara:strand:- start:654 stop:800 length:147 start_codon:yes stop_codon:yes gene_type:complete